MSRQAVEVFKRMRETHRFVRGMVAWLGFPAAFVDYERPARVSGETKYPWRNSARLAWNGMVSFSALPLRLSLWIGMMTMTVATVVVIFALLARFGWVGWVAPGWTSQVVIECMIGGAILISNGLMGEYIGRIFEAGKSRPLYVINYDTSKRSEEGSSMPQG